MTATLKSDRLAVRVYARHGDMCVCVAGNCASHHAPDDLVLVARFAYLQEGIDYATQGAAQGVSTRLVSRIVPTQPFVRDYPACKAQPAA